jgi:exodeoxyribonuclease V alpha subunit
MTMAWQWYLQGFAISNINLAGCVSTVIFSNDSTDYAVLVLSRLNEKSVVVTGNLSALCIGDYIEVVGKWVSHPVHKEQFQVASYAAVLPKSLDEWVLFFSSGAITGVGKSVANQLVDAFGADLIAILDKDPKQLLTISGIGEKKLQQITDSWLAQREQLSFMSYCLDRGVSMGIAKRIWGHWNRDALAQCQKNPYALIGKITGINFSVADRLANSALDNSDYRLKACIEDVFRVYAQTANVWMSQSVLLSEIGRRISWPDTVIAESVQQCLFTGDLAAFRDGDVVWMTTPLNHCTEQAIQAKMATLMAEPSLVSCDSDRAVSWLQSKITSQLSSDQYDALMGILCHKVVILYGGPGTGKTSMLQAVVQIMKQKTSHVICMAPTGKAAKRLGDSVKCRASTIHALMDYDEKAHVLTPKPLTCDVCIIDEMSMVDMYLWLDVLKMVPPHARLIMVGDPNQLPSIGPGQVFHDMIHRSKIPSFELVTNHRQQSHRGIPQLAATILVNRPMSRVSGGDLTGIHCTEDRDILRYVVELVQYRANETHGGTVHDIQVLAPIYKGELGLFQLNQVLAETLRPISAPANAFVGGDRVIQCRNNYSKRLMNGDIGYVKTVNSDGITIDIHQRDIVLETVDMVDLQLAYAVSIHKFQGSESPIIILPITRRWSYFMSIGVLYTAVTRAKTHLYVVGDMGVFSDMIRNAKHNYRHTGLWREPS